MYDEKGCTQKLPDMTLTSLASTIIILAGVQNLHSLISSSWCICNTHSENRAGPRVTWQVYPAPFIAFFVPTWYNQVALVIALS
jgi:hypothetical protein